MRAFCPPKNTPDKDIVMTPEYLAQDIINHFAPTGVILDPSRGTGAFYDNFPGDDKEWWWFDIIMWSILIVARSCTLCSFEFEVSLSRCVPRDF